MVEASKRLPVLHHPGCGACSLLRECGGVDAQRSLWGCFMDCQIPGRCEENNWTCPCRRDTFVRRWREVGGLPFRPSTQLLPMAHAELPLYVPMIQHGKSRIRPFDIDAVALPTSDVIAKRRNGHYGLRSCTASDLRSEYLIDARTKVLLVSVSDDDPLEIYWENRRAYKTPAALAKVGLVGMTAQNFSFFSDAPRPHILWNRARMVRIAEELSDAGVPVVLHLNALTSSDWAFWADLLKQNPLMSYVAKEFQTGNRTPREGAEAINALRELQQRVGRTLHPIVVGGAQFVRTLGEEFARFTIVDSVPFMRTMYREKIVVLPGGRKKWRRFPTKRGEPLDELLAINVKRYSEALAIAAAQAARSNKNQFMLPFDH